MTDPREPIFAAIRAATDGNPFNVPGRIQELHNLLDAWGVKRAAPTNSAPLDAFARALAVILKHEGGYVNHPKDPGGRTNLGVTQRVWEKWIGRTATEADMRALTPTMVAPLYRKEYWDACQCGDMAPAVALVLFDFAVNAGVHRASVTMQRIVGTTQDGKIGPATLAAINGRAPKAMVSSYSGARRDFYRGLRTFPTFGRGWLRRTDEVEQEALKWL